MSAQTTLTWRAGGWVVAGAALATLAVLGFALIGPLSGVRPVGDGRDPSTYAFDLSGMILPREGLAASGNPRDFLAALDAPAIMRGSDMVEHNAKRRGKYVVSGDRVIGVFIGGVARAYPLRLMNVHEVCNDEVAGIPIAVTYSPLTDSAVVFDRRIGDRVITLCVSGLLYNSNTLYYDRGGDGHVPSLWSQLAFRAVTSPAAGTPLELIPGVSVSNWGSWLMTHPDTEVVMPAESDERRMKSTSYERYWRDGRIGFPVVKLDPPASERTKPIGDISVRTGALFDQVLPPMTYVMAVRRADDWVVVPLPEIVRLCLPPTGLAETSGFGAPITWRGVPEQGAVVVSPPPNPVVIPCRWFAWDAFHPAPSREPPAPGAAPAAAAPAASAPAAQ